MPCWTLRGHGHWVNALALSTDYVMRIGAYDPRIADIVHDHCIFSILNNQAVFSACRVCCVGHYKVMVTGLTSWH